MYFRSLSIILTLFCVSARRIADAVTTFPAHRPYHPQQFVYVNPARMGPPRHHTVKGYVDFYPTGLAPRIRLGWLSGD
jgi:hypothetical protein